MRIVTENVTKNVTRNVTIVNEDASRTEFS